MTLQQHRMLKAAWVVFCTALFGGAASLLNWQIGLLVGGVAALAVGAMTYGSGAGTESNMQNESSLAAVDWSEPMSLTSMALYEDNFED